MDKLNQLKKLLTDTSAVQLIEDDIYSVLVDVAARHHYDRRATVYDMVVGTRVYNSVMWGSAPLDYIAFARQAVSSSGRGMALDAACGSMLFTASTYVQSARPIVALDQSLAMLRRARRRLIVLSGRVPEQVLFLQANLNDLPFRKAGFQTVLCMNVLHQFENASVLIPALEDMLTEGGQLYLTSLVLNNRLIGDTYLKVLHAIREFVRPRSNLELRNMLEGSLSQEVNYRVNGNMAFASTSLPGVVPDN